MKYRVQGISTLSIARFGCLLGWIITIIPSLACGLITWGILTTLGGWLESLRTLSLDLLGFEYTVDVVELLQLEELLVTLHAIQGRAWLLFVALVIVVGVSGGGLIALTLIVLGWGYNLVAWLTGGLEVELREMPVPSALPSNQRNPGDTNPPAGREDGG